MAELLAIERLTAGYGEAVVFSNLSLSLSKDQSLALLDGTLFVEGLSQEVAADPRVKAVYLGEEAHG